MESAQHPDLNQDQGLVTQWIATGRAVRVCVFVVYGLGSGLGGSQLKSRDSAVVRDSNPQYTKQAGRGVVDWMWQAKR